MYKFEVLRMKAKFVRGDSGTIWFQYAQNI